MTLNTAPTALPQPFGRDFPADPHAMYARLREQGSVHRVALPDGSPVWLVTREADVRQGLVDPRLSVNKRHSGTGFKGFALPPALDANLLNIDADDHLRLRRLVSQGFTPATSRACAAPSRRRWTRGSTGSWSAWNPRAGPTWWRSSPGPCHSR